MFKKDRDNYHIKFVSLKNVSDIKGALSHKRIFIYGLLSSVAHSLVKNDIIDGHYVFLSFDDVRIILSISSPTNFANAGSLMWWFEVVISIR